MEAAPLPGRPGHARSGRGCRRIRVQLLDQRLRAAGAARDQPGPRRSCPTWPFDRRLRRGRESRALPAPPGRSGFRRDRRGRRPQPRRRHDEAAQPCRPPEGRRAGQGRLRQDGLRNRDRPHEPQHSDPGRARNGPRLHTVLCPGVHRLPDELRRISEHPRAGRRPGHERRRIRHHAAVPGPVTRYPALILALAWSAALAAAVVLIPSQPGIGAVAIAAALPLMALALLLRPAIIALALAVALLAVGRAELPPVDPQIQVRAAVLAGSTVVVTGRVTDDSRPAGGGSEVLIEPSQLDTAAEAISGVGNLMVRWRGPGEASYGDQVRASGKLTLPRDLPAFDRRAYLAQRHVYLELQASSFEVTGSKTGIAGIPGWLRRRCIAALDDALPAPHASVLLGIVLGIRQGIPASLQNALIATGLIHLLVLSGLKVAVFARIVQGALKPMLGRHATWPAIALIGLYALAGGATPAAIRAAIMGGLAIAASRLGRPSHVWTSLAVTGAAMLAWHPELAWDVGFQLSFAGTAAIILLTPAIARRVAFLPHVVREPFAVTCAAQVGTLPMMATDFHVLSPVAPIANALTLPVLPILVACGLLLGALSFLPDVFDRLLAIPIAGLVVYVEQVAYLLARLPAASIAIPRFPTWMGVAYYSALGPAIAGARASGSARNLAFGAACA